MSLMGFQSGPDSYAIERQILDFNRCVSYLVAGLKCVEISRRAVAGLGESNGYKEGLIVMRFMLFIQILLHNISI